MKRPRAQNLLGALLIGGVLAALAAFAGAALFLRQPAVDAETLCRLDGPPAAHTLILVDSTDRLERRHKRRLEAIAAQERARLSQYDRLTLMRLDSRRPHEPAIIFSKCLPRPPEAANPLFENPRMAQAHWDAAFADALTRAVRNAQSGRTHRASPILAGLRAVAADPDFSAAIPQRRLVLVSDLLEHDPDGFSLYAPDATYAQWRAADPNGPPDLSAVELRISPLDRPENAHLQANARTAFWNPYLDETNARAISFDPAP